MDGISLIYYRYDKVATRWYLKCQIKFVKQPGKAQFVKYSLRYIDDRTMSSPVSHSYVQGYYIVSKALPTIAVNQKIKI